MLKSGWTMHGDENKIDIRKGDERVVLDIKKNNTEGLSVRDVPEA